MKEALTSKLVSPLTTLLRNAARFRFASSRCMAFAISHPQEKADIVSKLPNRLFLWMLHFSMLQHVFNKYPVSSGAVLDENVGDCTDDLAVLDDGTAAHSLNNAAGELQQVRIRHL